MLNKLLRTIEKLIPKKLYRAGQPIYHFCLTLLGAFIYRFPSRKLTIVAVTGTKGKSTTTELLASILEAAGHTTASLSTVQFKIAGKARPNLYKMTVPGRFFVQKFLRDAVNAGCTHVVMEVSSEAVKQSRHRFVEFDGLVFTNLAPEHIESHGSYEKYRDAKLALARAVATSKKPRIIIVANADDAEGGRFLDIAGESGVPYRLADAHAHEAVDDGSRFTFHDHVIHLHIHGTFNIMNALGAATMAEALGTPLEAIVRGLENVTMVRGRVEYVQRNPFAVVVDYAHTPESLESLYGIFSHHHNICVLGNTGGGRDTWKRSVMAGIAEQHCTEIILTNEDPYDEDPREIVTAMEDGIADKQKLTVIMDRREAIREALARARHHAGRTDQKPVAVLITGKGTDPYIMEAGGKKTPWDDATVVREELETLAATAQKR